MNSIGKRIMTALILTVLLLGLPLAGVMIAGKDVTAYMEFPPLTRYVEHAGFSWIAFIGLALAIAVVCFPFEFRILRWRNSVNQAPPPAERFPWWGWAGVIFGLGAWVIAWNRFEWVGSFQRHTFTPLWIAYIVVVNAMTFRRTGRCMMKNRPGYFVGLFVLSAVFWWFFEYLNRFVQNWSYHGIGEITALQYAVEATLPFSTVLPAVLGTFELLAGNPRVGAGLDSFPAIRIRRWKPIGWALLLVSCAGLACIGIWPGYLFPLLWLAPLGIPIALRTLQGERTVLSGIGQGRWRKPYLLAMSALICGCFWEMWNCYSLAKWVYSIPYLSAFRVFEMPVLGYAGYLPFGLECAVVAREFGLWSCDDVVSPAEKCVK